jgi:hypothetical protein
MPAARNHDAWIPPSHAGEKSAGSRTHTRARAGFEAIGTSVPS